MDDSYDEENVEKRSFKPKINFYLPPIPFKERYRLSPAQVRLLIDRIAPQYKLAGTRDVDLTIDQKVLVGLHCLASSSFYYVIGDTHGMQCDSCTFL